MTLDSLITYWITLNILTYKFCYSRETIVNHDTICFGNGCVFPYNEHYHSLKNSCVLDKLYYYHIIKVLIAAGSLEKIRHC